MIGIYIKCSNLNDYILIDKDDYDKVTYYKWFKVKDRKAQGYFRYQTSTKIDGKNKCFPIHRLIMNFPDNLIDHINRDTSDNRKCNLRETTRVVNSTNSKMFRTNKTGFRGVCKRKNKFIAQISVNNKKIYLGIYNSENEAAIAYKNALNKYKPGMREDA